MPFQKEDPKATRITKLHDQKKGERGNWDEHMREVLQYTIPSMDDIYFSRTPGGKENVHLYDGTGADSVLEFAAAMQSLTSNPAGNWFEFTTGNPLLDLETDVIKYKQEVADVIHSIFAGSNYYTENVSNLIDGGTLGTACLLLSEDDNDIIRCQASPIYHVYPKYDIMGRVYELSRELEMTYQQLERKFGEDVLAPLRIDSTFSTNAAKKYSVIHMVEATKKTGTPSSFDSIWVLRAPAIVLKEGIFNEMPYACPRFMVMSGEQLGRSFGMMALPDLKTLNSMMKVVLQSAQLAMLPPFKATDRGLMRPLVLKPGGTTYVRNMNDVEQLFTGGGGVSIGMDLIQMVRDNVKKRFLLDKLQTIQQDRMTATEIMQRRDENFRGVGAFFLRWTEEYIKPSIERTFNIASRKQLLPKAPAILSESPNLGIKYTSVLAKAQLAAQAENLNRVFANCAPVLEAQPDTWDLFDGDKIIKGSMSLFGAESSFLTNDAKVKNTRKARAEAEVAQLEREEEAGNVENVSKLQQ